MASFAMRMGSGGGPELETLRLASLLPEAEAEEEEAEDEDEAALPVAEVADEEDDGFRKTGSLGLMLGFTVDEARISVLESLVSFVDFEDEEDDEEDEDDDDEDTEVLDVADLCPTSVFFSTTLTSGTFTEAEAPLSDSLTWHKFL